MSYQPSTQHNYPPANESIPDRGTHGEYNSAPNGTQTDANWNSAAGAGNDPAHHHLGTATGAHSGNFTGAQGHPTHNNQYPPNADNIGQPGHNEAFYSGAPQTSTYDHTGPHSQHPTGEVIGASASVGPNISAGPPPGTGTGALGLGTGAGTHQVDPTYGSNHNTMGAASGAQPSRVSRFIGEAEKIAGELTSNQNLVQKGAIRSAGGTRAVMGRGSAGPHRNL